MNKDNSLVRIIAEIKNQLDFVLENLSSEDLQYKSGESPAIGWLIGHITGFQHFYSEIILRGNDGAFIPELEKYDTGSKSTFDKADELDFLIELYRKDSEQMVESLSKIDINKNVSAPDIVPPPFREVPIRDLMAFYVAHQFMHLGQILEVRRALGKRVWDM